MKLKVITPRLRKQTIFEPAPEQSVGFFADHVAQRFLYGAGDYTLALGGRVLPRDTRLATIPDGSKVELVIR